MNIASLLKDRHIELKPSGTLFAVEPLVAITHRVCPFCFNKLYEMKDKPFFYCKSVKHKNRFIISKDKMK